MARPRAGLLRFVRAGRKRRVGRTPLIGPMATSIRPSSSAARMDSGDRSMRVTSWHIDFRTALPSPSRRSDRPRAGWAAGADLVAGRMAHREMRKRETSFSSAPGSHTALSPNISRSLCIRATGRRSLSSGPIPALDRPHLFRRHSHAASPLASFQSAIDARLSSYHAPDPRHHTSQRHPFLFCFLFITKSV